MDGLLPIRISNHSGIVIMTGAQSAQPRSLLRVGAIAAALAVATLGAPPTRAQTPDPADIATAMNGHAVALRAEA